MNNLISSLPSPTISDITVGPFIIRFYALFIILGITLAILVSGIRLKNRGAKAGVAIDIAIWTVPIAIVGARLFHVLTHLNDYFGDGKNPMSIFYIWEGGLAIYGGIIFGALGAYIGARSVGIKFFAYADALVPGLLLAQAVGRWGNYFNNELFGQPTTLPWGLEISADNPAYPVGLPAGELFHPVFLYESIWSLLGIAVLLVLEKRFNLQWGKLFAAYLVYYSIGRAFIETIRLDPAYVLFGLRTNVWSALLGIIAGVVLFIYLGRKHTGIEQSVFVANSNAALDSDESGDALQDAGEPAKELDEEPAK